MPLSSALDDLHAHPDGHLVAWRHLLARPAATAPIPDHLSATLHQALLQRGITHLYTHQAQAIDAAARGEHVCVVTPTASGKSLCYLLPTLQRLTTDPQARALYLFPTKALAQDQLAELRRWPAVAAATYDGDTPTSARPKIRRSARVLITNPDMLHTGILPHHTQWAEFFEGLRLVALDEMHTYRGVFGSHVANVLRRLRRVAAFYGASPQFILSSATIANPAQLAEGLVEAPVTVVDEDGAPRGERHLICLNPPVVDRALGVRRSAAQQATLLARRFLAHDVQTAVFAGSRLTTEVILHQLRQTVHQPVSGYRGGYLPAERRRVETGLRDGSVRGVVTTNALELGVDIGGLDAVIMAGYPGSIASAWQQAGRAGRRGAPAAALLVAGGGPLDQYIMAHPDYLWGTASDRPAGSERALINPDNALILLDHLRCAAFELPFAQDESFGVDRAAVTQDLLALLADDGDLHRAGATWHWLADQYPAERVSLRTAGPDRILILAGEEAPDASRITDQVSPTPRTIGEIDRASAPRLVYPGAIYLHDAAPYQVTRLDWEAGRAWVEPVQVDYYTDAMGSSEVKVVGVTAERAVSGGQVGHGDVEITEKTTGYRQVRFGTGETLGWGEVDLPPQTMLTTAYWLRLDEATITRLRVEGWWRFDPNDYGPTWPQQRALARQRDGYRCRVCGAPEREGRQHDVHHLQPFRTFGYAVGHNRHDLQANRLDNLVTLCPQCHRRAEAHQLVRGALSGLAYTLGHLAPLYLMCDPRDLGIVTEAQAVATGVPTLYIHEHTPAGLGLTAALYDLHGRLVADARDLIRRCPCDHGCPACIGPTTDADVEAKAWTLRLLQELRGEG
ncbi:MAG: DEAD/DEAH box helicase [Anaerolineae bacterium]|nr:DEAD/DEAH box helicase [Anaerolineae bacterium]